MKPVVSDTPSNLIVLKQCTGNKTNPPIECWDQAMRDSISSQGIEKAFALMDLLYQKDPLFAENCHDIAHRLGRHAFKLFTEHRSFKLSPSTTYCNFGFYHGFLEQVIPNGETAILARDFCRFVDRELTTKTSSQGYLKQCYHGIGHGSVDIHNPNLRGQTEAMVSKAREFCENIFPDEDARSICGSGVFNGILVAHIQGVLSVNEQNPYAVCSKQPDYYKSDCYWQMTIATHFHYGHNFSKTISIISSIPEDTFASSSIRSLSVQMGSNNFREANHERHISLCRSLQSRLRLGCISGYVDGLMVNPVPNNEEAAAVNYCRSPIMTEDEHVVCFKELINNFVGFYPPPKIAQVCSKIEEKYRYLCQK